MNYSEFNNPRHPCGICHGEGLFPTESRDGSLLFVTKMKNRSNKGIVACNCTAGDRFSEPRGNFPRFSRPMMKLPDEMRGLLYVDPETGATEAEMAEWDALS